MRTTLLTMSLATLLAAPAMALDLGVGVDLGVGTNGTNETKRTDETWSVVVCRPETEAKRVRIDVGDAKAKHHEELALWDREATRDQKVQAYPIPPKFRENGKIWVQGDAEPKKHEVLMAVLYQGRAKRVYRFDDREAHDVSVNDADVDFTCKE